MLEGSKKFLISEKRRPPPPPPPEVWKMAFFAIFDLSSHLSLLHLTRLTQLYDFWLLFFSIIGLQNGKIEIFKKCRLHRKIGSRVTKKTDFLKNTESRPVLQKIENDKVMFFCIGDITYMLNFSKSPKYALKCYY